MIGKRWSRKDFMLGVAGSGLAMLVGCGDDEPAGDGDTSGSGGSGGSGSSNGAAGPASSSGAGASGPASGAGGTGAASSSSSSGAGGETTATCAAMVAAAISNNHGHALSIPLADIDAGVEKTYSAMGTATHCHEVTLTADDFATLKGGGSVTKFSCNGGDHEYVLSCAADPPAPGAPDCAATPDMGSC